MNKKETKEFLNSIVILASRYKFKIVIPKDNNLDITSFLINIKTKTITFEPKVIDITNLNN